jgi:hypothetical protein
MNARICERKIDVSKEETKSTHSKTKEKKLSLQYGISSA